MGLIRWARNLFAGIALGFATGGKFAAETATLRPPMEPITTPIRKRYQAEVTIAGGPGSQKIVDTFDSLPEETKRQIIAARGRGGYNRRTASRLGITQHPATVPANHPVETLDSILGGVALFTQSQREQSGTDKIARGLARAKGQHYALNERGQTVRTTEPDKNPRKSTDGQVEV
jgi:hypothetical protein